MPEHPLVQLLTLLRTDTPADKIRSTLVSLRSAEGWEALLAYCDDQAVAPLLHRALLPYREHVPLDALQWLRVSSSRTAATNLLLLAETQAVTQHLAGQGIDVLVLKGAPLAQELYGEVGLRPMNDLDLLCRREDVAQVRGALSERGYAWPHKELHPGARIDFETEMVLERMDVSTGFVYLCDLHWHLFDSPFYQHAIQLNWWWETAVPWRLGASEVQALGSEAQLLYLCAHAALHHQGGRILWICDIDHLLRQYRSELDWDLFLERVVAYRLPQAVQVVLLRAQEWFGTSLPGGLMSGLAALPPDPEAEGVLAVRTGPRPGIVGGFVDDLGRLPGWRNKLRFFLMNAFPSPAYMRQRYAIRRRWMLPAYYAYRLVAGFGDWLRLLLGWG